MVPPTLPKPTVYESPVPKSALLSKRGGKGREGRGGKGRRIDRVSSLDEDIRYIMVSGLGHRLHNARANCVHACCVCSFCAIKIAQTGSGGCAASFTHAYDCIVLLGKCNLCNAYVLCMYTSCTYQCTECDAQMQKRLAELGSQTCKANKACLAMQVCKRMEVRVVATNIMLVPGSVRACGFCMHTSTKDAAAFR